VYLPANPKRLLHDLAHLRDSTSATQRTPLVFCPSLLAYVHAFDRNYSHWTYLHMYPAFPIDPPFLATGNQLHQYGNRWVQRYWLPSQSTDLYAVGVVLVLLRYPISELALATPSVSIATLPLQLLYHAQPRRWVRSCRQHSVDPCPHTVTHLCTNLPFVLFLSCARHSYIHSELVSWLRFGQTPAPPRLDSLSFGCERNEFSSLVVGERLVPSKRVIVVE